MSQSTDITLAAAITGLAQRTELNSILTAIGSNHTGNVRPTYAVGGMLWVDDSSAPVWTIYLFDGTDDIAIGVVNISANTFVPSGTSLISFLNATVDKAATHTLDGTHAGKGIFCDATTASFTSNLTAAATLGLGWYAIITKNDATANTITIDPAGGELINGDTTLVLRNLNDTAFVHCTGTAFKAVVFSDAGNMKVSADDTTPGFVEDKIVIGDGIAMATLNGGGNEARRLSVDIGTNPGLEFSSGKLLAKVGAGLSLSGAGIMADYANIAANIAKGPSAMTVYTSGSGNFTILSANFIVIVGGAGGGGSAAQTNPGTNGGSSSFGSQSASGGIGGIQGGINNLSKQADGTGSGGALNMSGGGGNGGGAGIQYQGSGNNVIGGNGGQGGLSAQVYTSQTVGATLAYSVGSGGAGGAAGGVAGIAGKNGFVVIISF